MENDNTPPDLSYNVIAIMIESLFRCWDEQLRKQQIPFTPAQLRRDFYEGLQDIIHEMDEEPPSMGLFHGLDTYRIVLEKTLPAERLTPAQGYLERCVEQFEQGTQKLHSEDTIPQVHIDIRVEFDRIGRFVKFLDDGESPSQFQELRQPSLN